MLCGQLESAAEQAGRTKPAFNFYEDDFDTCKSMNTSDGQWNVAETEKKG